MLIDLVFDFMVVKLLRFRVITEAGRPIDACCTALMQCKKNIVNFFIVNLHSKTS